MVEPVKKSAESYIIEFYRVLPDLSELYTVLLRPTKLLPSFTEFYRVLPSFTRS